MKYSYEFPRPSLTVDCVVFGFDPNDATDPLKVLLIQRKDEPFINHWALPGGFVEVSDVTGEQGESLEEAAKRELEEETNIRLAYLEQLYTFGTPGRDPRGRVVSVAYFALVRTADYKPVGGSDASLAIWMGVEKALGRLPLAFDHKDILNTAVTRLRAKIRYAPIGFNLLPPKFTLSDLRVLYEGILGRKLDPSNFRKRVLATGILKETGQAQRGQHRPAPYYRFNKEAYKEAVRDGFNFEI